MLSQSVTSHATMTPMKDTPSMPMGISRQWKIRKDFPHKWVNEHLYNTNNQIHSVHTRFKTNLHPPIANLTKFQEGVYYSGIKIFNNLPHGIKDLANEITLFWNALKRFLLINSFYNSEEYFNYQR